MYNAYVQFINNSDSEVPFLQWKKIPTTNKKDIEFEEETTESVEFETETETEEIKLKEDIEFETETETETIEQLRVNTLYYINDNGYERYLNNEYQDYLYKMCIKYNVENYYSLFLAQMYHESGFNVNVISTTNDYGLMQINICNHEWLSKKLGNGDFLNPYTNIEAGVYLMSMFLHKYNDVEKALVCYNMGERAVINGTHSTVYSKGVLSDMNLLIILEKGGKP
jgi:membrane-bound lytic murein transglycosylase MltF